MSYILDALKKIEHEKNRKIRSDGRISISGDLFHERKKPPSRSALWKVLALVTAASLLTCAGTWYLLQGGSRKSREVVRPAAAPPPAPAAPSSAAVPAPVQSQVSAAGVPPVATSAAVPAASKSAETVPDDDYSARKARRTKKQAKVISPSPQQPVQTVQAPADIKLSGIAWQDDRAARRVVINGFLLKEGAVVSGAKITDIQADRVRFTSAAGQFEIKLDAVLPAGAQR